MPRALFRPLRRRRPLLQTTILRIHGTPSNQTDPHPRLPAHRDPRPANDTPAAAAGLAASHDGAPNRDALAYVATVLGHLTNRDIPRAAPAHARGPHPDDVLLHRYAKAGLVDRARTLFDGMPAKAKGVVAWTSLVSGYFRAGRVDEARALFDGMPARNVVSWTVMVQGYARAGMLTEAREMFDAMPERNLVTWNVMVNAYAKRGQVQEAMELFDTMPWRDSYSWTAMISCFFRAGRVDEAVRLFERMQDRNAVAWTLMVNGLVRNGRVSTAREFFDRMPGNKDTVAWHAMLNAYANAGRMDEAWTLFESMPAKDLVSWSIVIDGYAKIGLKDEAMGLFILMLRSGVSPNSTTLTSVLVTSESTVEIGQIHGLATTLGLLSETSLGNALLTMYSRSGDLHSAWQAFKMLHEKDAITWTSMMQAFVKHGHASCALQAFAQMLRHGHEPSSTTFSTALSACRHAGLFKKGRNISAYICRTYGLKSTIAHRDILGEVVAVMPLETHDQAMKLKKRKKKNKKKYVNAGRLAIEEPAGLEAAAATQCTPTKAATISVAILQASLGRKKKNEKKSVEDSRLAIEEPTVAATECTLRKDATISVVTLQASLGQQGL